MHGLGRGFQGVRFGVYGISSLLFLSTVVIAACNRGWGSSVASSSQIEGQSVESR